MPVSLPQLMPGRRSKDLCHLFDPSPHLPPRRETPQGWICHHRSGTFIDMSSTSEMVQEGDTTSAQKHTHTHSVAIEIQSENRMPYRDKFGFICFKRKSPMRNGRRARCRREGSLNLVQIMVEIGDSWERGVTYVDKDVHEARVKPPNDPPRSKGGH